MADPAYYEAVGNELDVFRAAYHQGIAVMLKGPTGCGKTRLVEAMAQALGVELITVACHEDLTAADLVGRYLLEHDSTVWVDGPLTRAVRAGCLVYLDEVVEARQDTTVVLHPLTDHRRELPIERLGITLSAPPTFGLVMSYNPGYQSVLKDLKESTRQRMAAIELGFPPCDVERRIVTHESGLDAEPTDHLVRLATAIRSIADGLPHEVASTRTLVTAAKLAVSGLDLRTAAEAAIRGPLTDDPHAARALQALIDVCLPKDVVTDR